MIPYHRDVPCTDPQKLDLKSNDWRSVFFMVKYSFELKKEIVVAYLSGKGGFGSLAKDYGIPNKEQIHRWVKTYQKLGDDGLRGSQRKKNYSFEYKISVVESYLSSEISYQDLALQEGITNPTMIINWVNRFLAVGPDALRPHKKGRKKKLDNPTRKTTKECNSTPATDAKTAYVKQLEDELLQLRIENAFLKELRRLRLEDEARMREQHESSAASEDSSN